MKSFNDYMRTVEQEQNRPIIGDKFLLNLNNITLYETTVIGHGKKHITILADSTIFKAISESKTTKIKDEDQLDDDDDENYEDPTEKDDDDYAHMTESLKVYVQNSATGELKTLSASKMLKNGLLENIVTVSHRIRGYEPRSKFNTWTINV